MSTILNYKYGVLHNNELLTLHHEPPSYRPFNEELIEYVVVEFDDNGIIKVAGDLVVHDWFSPMWQNDEQPIEKVEQVYYAHDYKIVERRKRKWLFFGPVTKTTVAVMKNGWCERIKRACFTGRYTNLRVVEAHE